MSEETFQAQQAETVRDQYQTLPSAVNNSSAGCRYGVVADR
jgi:hypothetical protein